MVCILLKTATELFFKKQTEAKDENPKTCDSIYYILFFNGWRISQEVNGIKELLLLYLLGGTGAEGLDGVPGFFKES